MKPGNYLILLAICLLLPAIAFPQDGNTPWKGLSDQSNKLRIKLTGRSYTMTFPSKGTHFYHSDFLPAKIVLENGEVCDSIMVRYNSYLDDLVCYNPNLKTLFVIDKYIVREFEVHLPNSATEKFMKVKFDGENNEGTFLRVLYDGSLILYAHYKTSEIITAVYKDINGILKNSEFRMTESFYIQSTNGKIEKFTPTRESFYHLFSQHKKQVKQILRKVRLSHITGNELEKVFTRISDSGIHN